MIDVMEDHVKARDSFAVETTLAAKGYMRRIRVWRASGYNVKLMFLKLTSEDFAVDRVALRVSQGGHNIPEHVIR
jgi:predicted ABC-type ATPase